jgi:hypothetical protein
MCHFCIRVGLLTINHALRSLCMLYIVLAHVNVCMMLLLNMHGTSEPFYIVLWVSSQIECDPSIIIGSMLFWFFHPFFVFI